MLLPYKHTQLLFFYTFTRCTRTLIIWLMVHVEFVGTCEWKMNKWKFQILMKISCLSKMYIIGKETKKFVRYTSLFGRQSKQKAFTWNFISIENLINFLVFYLKLFLTLRLSPENYSTFNRSLLLSCNLRIF